MNIREENNWNITKRVLKTSQRNSEVGQPSTLPTESVWRKYQKKY
jgi:hypothetical protein